MTTDTNTKAPNSVRHLPSFAQTLRDEADKCDLFGINRPAELLRDAAAIIAEAQTDHIPGAGKMVQPVAVPVGEVQRRHYGGRSRNIGFDVAELYQGANLQPGAKLYSAPAPALVPLTDEQIDKIAEAAFDAFMRDGNDDYDRAFARAIERAHGIGGEA